MAYVTEAFAAYFTETLTADATTLPLSDEAKADLTALLAEDDAYTFAAIKGDVTYEVIKITASGDVLLIERGQGGTTAVQHACGACMQLVSPAIVEAIKSLICEYDCCEDGDCECDAVAVAGTYMPQGTVGYEWEGAVVFSGDTPVTMAASGMPSWMTATANGLVLTLSGTPTAKGTTVFSVAAANCNGTNVATTQVTLTVA